MQQDSSYFTFKRKAFVGLLMPAFLGSCILGTLFFFSYQWFLKHRHQVLESEKQGIYKDLILSAIYEKNRSIGLLLALNSKDDLKSLRMETDFALKRLEILLTNYQHLYAEELKSVILLRNKIELLRTEVLSQDFSVEKVQNTFLSINTMIQENLKFLMLELGQDLSSSLQKVQNLSIAYDHLLLASFKNMPLTDSHFFAIAKSWFDYTHASTKGDSENLELMASNNLVEKVLKEREHGAFNVPVKQVEQLFTPLFIKDEKQLNNDFQNYVLEIQATEKLTRQLVLLAGFFISLLGISYLAWSRSVYRQWCSDFLRDHRIARHYRRHKSKNDGSALYWNDRNDLIVFLREIKNNLREIRKQALKAKAIEVNRQLQNDYIPFQDDEGSRLKDYLSSILVEGSKALGAIDEGLSEPSLKAAHGKDGKADDCKPPVLAINMNPLDGSPGNIVSRYAEYSDTKKSA